MTDDERFLNAATRGLSRRARGAAQAELRSHLHEQTQQLMLDGKAEAAAKEQVLLELGPASVVAWNLIQTHPIHWKTAVLVTGVLVVLPGLVVELLSQLFP